MSDEKLDNQQNVTIPIKEHFKNVETIKPYSEAEDWEIRDVISALAWFIEDLDNYDDEESQIVADEMLYCIYNFIAENHDKLENNEFSKELEKGINILQERLGKNNDTTMYSRYYLQKIKMELKVLDSQVMFVYEKKVKK